MAKNQRLIIFIVIGAFMVSIVGSAILILAGNGDSVSHNNRDDASSEQLEDIERQLAEQQAQQQQQEQLDQARATCGPLPASVDSGPLEVPDFDLPDADITELSTVDLAEGTGNEASAGDCIVANYHGVLPDGTVFDSSFERGSPNRFSLLSVIEGWGVGIPGMKEGGVRVLYIPTELGYDDRGAAPLIQPGDDLVFVVELIEVVEL